MNLPIIQSLWIGKELSNIEQLCIASFLKNGHEFHLYTYGEVKSIPEGTIIKDAKKIILEKDIFKNNAGSLAIFADWFRWELLYQKGGFWVDMDVVCLQPFTFEGDIIFGLENSSKSAIGVLKFPAKHKLTNFLRNMCDKPNTLLPYDSTKQKLIKLKRRFLGNHRGNVTWGEAGGPIGFSKALKHLAIKNKAQPYIYFYPVHHSCWEAIFDETFKHDVALFNNSYAIHLWNEMMRRDNTFDKDACFPEESLFEQLKTKYMN